MCNCIKELNAELRRQYCDPEAELNTTLSFGEGGTEYPTIQASVRTKTVAGQLSLHTRQKLVIPVFCPFCGTRYKKET